MKKLVSSFLMMLLMVMTFSMTVFAASSAGLNKQKVTLGVGGSEELSLNVTSGGPVFWDTTDASIATVEDGIVTAKAAGKCTVSAINGGKTYKCQVTVKKVLFSTKSLKIYTGESGAVILQGATIANTVSDKPEIAAISGNEIYGKKPGKAVVTVTDNAGKTYKCNVKVVTELSKKSLKLAPNEAYTLSLLGGTIKDATSNKTNVVVADKDGNLTAISSGSAVVTVTDELGKTYKCNVKVGISINKTSVSLYKGDSFNVEVKGDTIKEIKAKKSRKYVVTTYNYGQYGQISGYNKGKTTVTVKTTTGKKFKVKVTVKGPSLSNKSLTVPCGQTAQLSIKGGYIQSMKSNNTGIATVEKQNNTYGVIKAGTKPGKTTIVVQESYKKSYKCTVTVVPALETDTVKTHPNEQKIIKLYGDTITSATSADTGVLTVNSNGIVTGVKKGKTIVTLKGKNNKKYYCQVTVNDPLHIVLEVNENAVLEDDYEDNKNYKEFVFYATASEEVDGITLYDETSGTKQMICEMNDDGRYSSNGDELSNDLVFTTKYYANIDDPKEMKFSATALLNGKEESAETTIKVVKKFGSEELAAMESVDAELEAVSGADEETRKGNAATKLADLVSAGKISEVSEYDNGLYTFKYSTGVLGGIMIKDRIDDENGEVMDSEIFEALPENVEEVIVDAEDTLAENADDVVIEDEIVESAEDYTVDYAAPSVPTRDSKYAGSIISSLVEEEDDAILGDTQNLANVKVFYAFDDFSLSGRKPPYIAKQSEWAAKGVTMDIDTEVTVDDLKSIKDEDIAIFSMHGGMYDDDTPALCLLEEPTKELNAKYNLDLSTGRIANVTTTSGRTEYWVLPGFFEGNYSKDAFNDKVILSETCVFYGEDPTVTEVMANDILSCGAETVIGFHNSVYAGYSRDMTFGYCDGLFNGKTIGEAFADCKAKYGENDGGDPAYPILKGDADYRLYSDSLQNGGFELSNKPVKWNPVGDARVINKLGPIDAPQGSRMGFITTGIGSKSTAYNGTEGSVLSQTFKVPTDAKTLTFTYNVISEEPMEWVNRGFDDKFYANIYNASGTLIDLIAEESVNKAQWYSIDGIDFDGGDATCYETHWKNVSYDVTALRGQTVTLEFTVFDVGDSAWDTAALIDKVRIN